MLSHFDPVTEKVSELTARSPTKNCMSDPIPTFLMKQCLNDVVPLVTAIINVSLSTGTVPKQFKQAVVTPLLKKPGLDTNDLKHFRPVSIKSAIYCKDSLEDCPETASETSV